MWDIGIFLLFFSICFTIIEIDSTKPLLSIKSDVSNLILLKGILLKNIIVYIIIIVGTRLNKYIALVIDSVNGIVLGLITGQFRYLEYWALIIPHGILEIPLYIYLGYVCRQQKKISVRFIVFTGLGVILAGFVEAYITPAVMNYVLLKGH